MVPNLPLRGIDGDRCFLVPDRGKDRHVIGAVQGRPDEKQSPLVASEPGLPEKGGAIGNTERGYRLDLFAITGREGRKLAFDIPSSAFHTLH